MRLSEGFNFAYSASGILNIVKEVTMRDLENSDDKSYPCILQYILFPPHTVIYSALESNESFEESDEGILLLLIFNPRTSLFSMQLFY